LRRNCASSLERAKKAADAKKLYAKLKADEAKNPLAFANLARDASDDLASKSAGGDLGFRSRDEIEKQWGHEVAAAALSLKDPGQESGLVEGPQGFHIVKLGRRQPALNRPFEEVKAQLVARIGRERRTKDFDEYVKKLREKADVKVDDAELEKVVVTSAPAGATPTPPVALDPHGAGTPAPAQR
jgi:peptidyl-prolyl cis-trans isomerase C